MTTQGSVRRVYRFGASFVVVVMLVALFVSGFGASVASAQEAQTRVRVIHAIPDAPAVDVYVNGAKAVSNISFFTVTGYLTIAPGSYLIQVTPAGATLGPDTTVIQRRLTFKAGDYSVTARGTLDRSDDVGVGLTKAFDNDETPADGQALVRVAHFSPDAPAVDIYANGALVVEGIEFYDVSDYLSVPAGTYTIGVAPAGGEVIYTTSVTVAAGQIATAWANGLLGGTGDQAFEVTASIDN